ncbi:TonB-dependent receptor plug domain-containing protein [Thalassomonas haliotis]|uniref:TonB-dependent receptor n=1 Tax=Thalassomonas haliotis TaxID=485448 RepID=A0ABY7VDP4_9GAMM|nr:TonB-dependent receptor [Thalassomonas haliotis]WDE11668.1 TonB-dependent receptor [Thalassomonas haliotis]
MKYPSLALAITAALPTLTPQLAFAQEKSELEIIEVRGVRQKLEQAGRLKDVIQKTEVLDQAMIDNKNALSLAEAIQDEPGVRVSNECSMCGVKRVMLNGMKGEHTTILVDDLPTHTLISGFYAVDAIATTGVDRIEIARGAGASLIAPEAIGGTINIITKDAYENTATFDYALGSHDFTAFKGSATGISEDGKTGITLIAQYDKQDQEDHDSNGVSEAPFQENQSYTARISQDLNDYHNVQVRVSKVNSEVFGGPVIGKLTNSIGAALSGFDGIDSGQLFTDNDVRKAFIGKPWETTEWIKTSRDEAYVKWLTEQNNDLSSEFAVSWAKHEQDSFYEGIDYYADNEMMYLRAKFDYFLNDKHFLSFGIDSRQEEMRSDTKALSGVDAYISDSFDYKTYGFFFQDMWTPNDDLEIALALRLDKVEADFIDPQKPGTEIEETILAPRLDIRFFHSQALTSRLSAGRGYRAPLSFFETDHGILDAELGYQIDVQELERSMSFNYSLSFEGEALTATLSAATSQVEHLAELSETEGGVPVLTQLDKKARVTTLDLVGGYQLTDRLLVNLSLERFIYDDAFKSSYAIAPIEDRIGMDLNWQRNALEVNFSTTWFGSRDLRDYGYMGNNVLNNPATAKPLDAGSFSISNIKLKYRLTAHAALYAGVSNLFEYTQIDEGDTPLFFDASGGYDVAYIYGPLHGREFYAGLEIKL